MKITAENIKENLKVESQFAHTKIRIKSPEHSKAFQEAVFAEGVLWVGDEEPCVRYTDKPFLYINKYLRMSHTSKGTDEYFNNVSYKEIEFSMNNEFKLEDLKDGMIVQCRNGTTYLVLSGSFVRSTGYTPQSYYTNFPKNDGDREWDVVKIYSPQIKPFNFSNTINTEESRLLWEEQSPVQKEIEEIEAQQRKLADKLSKLKDKL